MIKALQTLTKAIITMAIGIFINGDMNLIILSILYSF